LNSRKREIKTNEANLALKIILATIRQRLMSRKSRQ
jgi:hypothetical protein